MTKKLVKWAVLGNAYRAPEIRAYVLGGEYEGKRLQTSTIVEVLGPRTVRTYSGSVYELVGDEVDEAHWRYDGAPVSDPLKGVRYCLKIQEEQAA